MTSAKTSILQKIDVALTLNPIHAKPCATPPANEVWADAPAENVLSLFAEQLTHVGGKFIYVEDSAQVVDTLTLLIKKLSTSPLLYCPYPPIKESLICEHFRWTDLAHEAEIAITNCVALIARTGSIAIDETKGKLESIGCPIHLILATEDQVVFDMSEVCTPTQMEQSATLSLLTGPSRTADIEKTLVVGVHGSKEVYVLLVKKP